MEMKKYFFDDLTGDLLGSLPKHTVSLTVFFPKEDRLKVSVLTARYGASGELCYCFIVDSTPFILLDLHFTFSRSKDNFKKDFKEIMQK